VKAINPYRRPTRLPRSIGNAATSAGADDAVIVLSERLHDKGPHLVLVSPDGDVYPIPYLDYRAELLWEAHPAWVVGTFNTQAKLTDIADALMHTWREQQQEAA
jgi:hypothetical protein